MYALMSTIESTSKIEFLTDLESLIEETNAEDEAPRDEIKTETLNQNAKELEVGQYVVIWTSILSQCFDTNLNVPFLPGIPVQKSP